MTAAASHPETDRARPDPTVRNVLLLALCQALAMSASGMTITMAALVGHLLAEDKGLATLPFACQFLATMVATLPASLLMARIGRRAGFSLGALLGVAAGLTSWWAIVEASFALFCFGAALFGAASAFAYFYRFAAADTASEAFKSKAISLVMAGGLIAAFLGPQIAVWTRELMAPLLFAGSYLAIAGLAGLALLVLQFIRIPRPSVAERSAPGRPLLAIMRQRKFLVAVLAAIVGYGGMNIVMTATPLAMMACAHPFESAALVIQWHAVGMFAPAFFTGNLIRRYGCERVIAAGGLLMLGCVAVNLSGVAVWNFWLALFLLGVGWSFMFIGGTTLLTETYRPEERAKVQGLNDLLVFGSVAVTAWSSGQILDALGWQAINVSLLLPVVLALGLALWFGRRPAPAPSA